MQTLQAFSISLPFFGLILVGYLSGRWRKLPESGLVWMNFFIIYIALPALFFQMLRKTPVAELQQFEFILANTGSTALIYLSAYLIGLWVLKRSGKESVALGFASSYSNIGYMGLPLVISALGESAVVPAALVFSFDNALFFILTPALMAMYDNKGTRWYVTLIASIKAVLTHPFIIATIAGILAAVIKLPVPNAIDNFLTLLQGAAGPCALFAMGVILGLRQIHVKQVDIGIALIFKLVLHPLLVYFVVKSIPGITPVWLYTAVLMATLPPAANVFILAQQYGTFVERASAIVVIGTLIALMTVTSILYLIQQQSL